MQIDLTAVFQKVPEGYIGFVEELPGANTQGATFEAARANLQEAIALVLEANHAFAKRGVGDPGDGGRRRRANPSRGQVTLRAGLHTAGCSAMLVTFA